jgi:hypothetical protein
MDKEKIYNELNKIHEKFLIELYKYKKLCEIIDFLDSRKILYKK